MTVPVVLFTSLYVILNILKTQREYFIVILRGVTVASLVPKIQDFVVDAGKGTP